MKSAEELITPVAHGAGLDMDASRFDSEESQGIAAHAKESGAKLILRGIGDRPADELAEIGAFGGGAVVFVL